MTEKQFKMFRVTFSPEDRLRIEALKESHCNRAEVCLFRVLVDRCMRRYPEGGTIDRKFLKLCKRADESLESFGADGIQSSLDLGTMYEGYCQSMHEEFGFAGAGRMLRALVVLAGDDQL